MDVSASRLLRCLADETRLRIVLTLLAEGQLCVCELTHALDETQPKISRHLGQLRAARMVIDQRSEQWVFYRLSDQLPEWARTMLKALLNEQAHLVRNAQSRLAEMTSRPGTNPAHSSGTHIVLKRSDH